MKKVTPKPKTCEGCPAFEKGQGFCPPEGNKVDPDMTFVFDGPSDLAHRFSVPFANKQKPFGPMFEGWVDEAGIDRDRIQRTNIVWCWLPGGRTNQIHVGQRNPTPEEAEFCMKRHLLPHLRRTGAFDEGHVIVTVGHQATRYLRGIEGSIEPHLGVVDGFTDPER